MLLREYLDDYHTPDVVFYRSINRMAMASVANICILPLQDVLGLDNSARMNTPGTVENNWSWRLLPGQITEELGQEMLVATKRYGRANWEALNALEKAKKAAKKADEKAEESEVEVKAENEE